MRLSPVPDLTPGRRLLLASLAVALVVSLLLAFKLDVRGRLGDTDDAMRLVMVRDLLAGRGWYDQSIGRLQPPWGLYMHWSRLLDGGIAALMAALRLAFAPATAEWMTRVIWPLSWIFPAVTAALCLARNIGARSAVMITAVLLLIDLEIYRQFIPGRIDHHNIQIVMTLIALACATTDQRRARWAPLGAAAACLGLGIGLEALPLQAMIGASWALRLAFDRREAPAAAAYGASLALGGVLVFLAQTPPWRWELPVCDAMGSNLVGALLVAGVGLALAAWAAGRAPAMARFACVALAGGAAAGIYLVLHPSCLHGPFAAVDPLARRLWLNGVEEVQPLWNILKLDRTSAINAAVVIVMAVGAMIFLLSQKAERNANLLLTSLALAAACVLACLVWRMMDYVYWIGLPMIGAAFSRLAMRRLRNLLVPTLGVSILLSPTSLAVAANTADKAVAPRRVPSSSADMERCFAPHVFGALRALPPGPVLSEPDLGPFILAFTRHSALVAPYHRMSHEMILAHAAFDAPAPADQAKVRALGAAYLVDCLPLSLEVRPDGLGARLRTGRTPAWLERVSADGATLRIWRVRQP
jgi:hypothetical protein